MGHPVKKILDKNLVIKLYVFNIYIYKNQNPQTGYLENWERGEKLRIYETNSVHFIARYRVLRHFLADKDFENHKNFED